MPLRCGLVMRAHDVASNGTSEIAKRPPTLPVALLREVVESRALHLASDQEVVAWPIVPVDKMK